ncbi:hypothetical protein VOI32_36045 [Paraburkholderia caribensis]|uniref:NACHT-associated inactive Restriction Endonuclease 2 domain-containing protein n=1 Tax=Paraburkholderia caribensis TaxID=75105 RepID=A0ABV0EB56_9BURK|nr:hypothetical protein [Paraburkholderia caribensis]PTB23516.1 hypothetical protein C9I56_38775 [Paraburkholderia caribensis]
MSDAERKKLTDTYKRYGFSLARQTSEVLVFTLKTGYFDNADIIPAQTGQDVSVTFNEFTKIGFACTIRPPMSAEEAEKQLFRGFFSVDSTRDRLQASYRKFTKQITEPYGVGAKYSYVTAPYHVNGVTGTGTVPSEILSRLSLKKPILFLIEAAAGFGKTCTAQEIVNGLIENSDYLPLYAELSRNRQARVFRHILLDEIDRTFPLLGSRLVQSEIQNGRVITVLDGFDELLRAKEDSSDFEYREPMLETISDYLKGSAKIVLTTRRTVLFDGDEFHKWVDSHVNEFELVRIKISEPQISDWLPSNRIERLNAIGVDVRLFANPVLLSYLKLIGDQKFDDICCDSESIVESYFTFMLDRERTRQDLRMDVSHQHIVLSSIAKDMMTFGYTAEERDYIIDQILRSHGVLLDKVQLAYSSSEKPSREELANKLASHALLDRNSSETNKISFVNEFAFGNYIASNIISDETWLDDDARFIEPAVLSYVPRHEQARVNLWRRLESVVDYMPITSKIDTALRLGMPIDFQLQDGEAEGIRFARITIGHASVKAFQFNDCWFSDCVFVKSSLSDVSFLDCRFYNCSIIVEEESVEGGIYLFGCTCDDAFSAQLARSNAIVAQRTADRDRSLERYILEKFWPLGRDKFVYLHRPTKILCARSADFGPEELYPALESLKRKGIVSDSQTPSFFELKLEEMQSIREILGR